MFKASSNQQQLDCATLLWFSVPFPNNWIQKMLQNPPKEPIKKQENHQRSIKNPSENQKSQWKKPANITIMFRKRQTDFGTETSNPRPPPDGSASHGLFPEAQGWFHSGRGCPGHSKKVRWRAKMGGQNKKMHYKLEFFFETKFVFSSWFCRFFFAKRTTEFFCAKISEGLQCERPHEDLQRSWGSDELSQPWSGASGYLGKAPTEPTGLHFRCFGAALCGLRYQPGCSERLFISGVVALFCWLNNNGVM